MTTKQLRENLSAVVKQLNRGEAVQLSYRHKVIGVLQPVTTPQPTLRRGSAEAIRTSLNNLQNELASVQRPVDPRPIKEQLADIRSRKYNP